ncbi:MAG: SusD/RagB family nutrient-binding outer membrane lipoprotein [Flavobacteriaceae bacterium]|nr:SusD/RagB family nutrient-binding outer membrane lipoprotein [Flavobacteriaceae bacterium]
MKKINNLIKMLVLCGGLFFASCETTDLDLTQNPNALSPVDADPDFYLNQIQLSYAYLIESFGNTAGAVTRIDYMRGKDYANAYQPGSFNGRWSSAYQTIMQDIREMNVIADESGLTHHKGIGQFIEAHVLITLVDFFGDVPYTEAFQGAVNLNPVADSGASVYAVALGLLDSAIANFNSDALGEPRWTSTVTDPFYDGDWTAWTKAANTLKMNAYMNTRNVDGSSVANFNAIVASGNYIATTADDMQFKWGTLAVQPDSRHPRYRNNYTSTGGGSYMSNSLMDYMRGGPDGGYSIGLGEFYADPRIMFYYHRQTNPTPGIDGDANEEVLECGLQNAPAHYAGYVFCANPQGWWGRDHGNDNGIPPDGFLRTLAGVYPAGGKLDDWSYGGQTDGAGNAGNGVTPILLASWQDFLIAEAELVSGDEVAAKNAMFVGIQKSMDKVLNFYPRTERFDAIMDIYFGGLAFVEQQFYARISDEWDAAANVMDVLGMQSFVAQYGNGLGAYNFYRRTGFPTTLQPNIEPNPGGFIRSFYYPGDHANNNSNISQKSGVTEPVFWDNGGASPGFPAAN